jgi:hypothetical protein
MSSLDIIVDKTFLDTEVFKLRMIGKQWLLDDVESRLVVSEDVSQWIK